MSPVFVGNIDVALVTFYAFVLFFIGLVIYLNRESRREGFPREDDLSGRIESPSLILDGRPKRFRLPFGRDAIVAREREPVAIAAKRERFSGAPYRPTGNPMIDGVGPAAWAERRRVPDLDMEGHPRIVPIANAHGVRLDKRDPALIGKPVFGCDGVQAGVITDVWVDRAERLIRYLAIDIGSRVVLAPMATASVRRAGVTIDAVTAAQFADVPAIEGTDTITFYDEERIQAYFGGGYLYATAERQEPIL